MFLAALLISLMELGASSRVLSSSHPAYVSPITKYHKSRLLTSSLQSSNASFRFITTSPLRDRYCKAVISEESSSRENVKRMSTEFSNEFELSSLTALSPLDGRYWGKVKDLAPFMSEYGLIRFRVFVEIKWLLKLSQIPEVTEVPSFSKEAQSYLEGLIDGFSMRDALEVKNIEKVTNHDVKAVEYFLKQKCQSHPEISKVLEFFHFACTSEDINNLAHALMLKEAVITVMFPIMDELIMAICKLAKDNAHIPMLSRTHGQVTSYFNAKLK